MDIERAYNALVKLAISQNISVEKVIEDIEIAIREGYEATVKSGDKIALAMWNQIPRVGKLPSAVEMVAYMGETIFSQTPKQMEMIGDDWVLDNRKSLS